MADIITNLYASLTWIIPFVLVLGFLVSAHEFGHYLSARRHGVKIETFSIGFGPEFFGFTDKAGTRWKFSMIPLGGYVKMFGDADVSSQPDREKQRELTPQEYAQTLESKAIWKRIEVSAAGPIANLLISMFCLAILFACQGQENPAPVITVIPDGVAEKAGFKTNDKILSINGQEVSHYRHIPNIIRKNPGKPLEVKIKRNQEILNLNVTPRLHQESSSETVGLIDVKTVLIPHTVLGAIKAGIWTTIVKSNEMVNALIDLVKGKEDASQMGSVLSIAKMAHESWQGSIFNLLTFIGLLSLNLGVLNLLPIPMLDGGHIVLYCIEAIRGKPLSDAFQKWFFRIGLWLIGFVMIYTLGNDIKRFFVLPSFISNFFN